MSSGTASTNWGVRMSGQMSSSHSSEGYFKSAFYRRSQRHWASFIHSSNLLVNIHLMSFPLCCLTFLTGVSLLSQINNLSSHLGLCFWNTRTKVCGQREKAQVPIPLLSLWGAGGWAGSWATAWPCSNGILFQWRIPHHAVSPFLY